MLYKNQKILIIKFQKNKLQKFLITILKKSGINLNRYDKINNKLTSNKSLQGIYEKLILKIIEIPYDIKWQKKKLFKNIFPL